MTDNIYHTDKRPLDSQGQKLKPLDLVLLGDITSYHWCEEGTEFLRNYAGYYGLVTYHPGFDGFHEPFYLGNKSHPGWTSGDASMVYVETRRIHEEEDEVCSYDLWIPPANLTKLPFNALIMNIFAEYPWEMQDVDGPSSYLFIRSGVPEFDYLKHIMQCPYEKLVEAHNSAMEAVMFRIDDPT